MSDARLRELERRYRETGADEDLVLWLVARLRAGALSAERLRMLAALNHGAARAALGEVGELKQQAPGPLAQLRTEVLGAQAAAQELLGLDLSELLGRPEIEAVGDWVLRIEPWGGGPLLRAACAASRLALPAFARERPGDGRVFAALEAAEDYLGAPSARAGVLASQASREALRAARDVHPEDLMPGLQAPARDAACAANQAAKLAHVLSTQFMDDGEPEDPEADLEAGAEMVARIHGMVAARSACYAAGAVGVEPVQDAVRAALARWVIG